MLDWLKVSIGVRIMKWSVLAEAFDVIGALDMVYQGLDCVTPSKQVSEPIEVDSPGVAATFGKQLEFTGTRMISPDPLLEPNASNLG